MIFLFFFLFTRHSIVKNPSWNIDVNLAVSALLGSVYFWLKVLVTEPCWSSCLAQISISFALSKSLISISWGSYNWFDIMTSYFWRTKTNFWYKPRWRSKIKTKIIIGRAHRDKSYPYGRAWSPTWVRCVPGHLNKLYMGQLIFLLTLSKGRVSSSKDFLHSEIVIMHYRDIS